ncbi:MAG: tetratricopeptide repeat protein [Cytophagales bacterium]|nr:tetratricopeptide repeat protein [Cytophagales bacterium]MDW8384308.1 tetratricopeptide repeat protein [Flammeovirgaceae bacterium]
MKTLLSVAVCLFFIIRTVALAQNNVNSPAKPPTASSPSRTFIAKGDALYAQKKFTDAIAEYEHAIALDPDDGMTHYKIGLCYLNLKDNESAAKSFEKSIAIDNNMKQSYMNLMKIHKSTGDDNKAIEVLDKLFKIEKDSIKKLESKLEIVKILCENKDYKRAALHIKDAMALNNKDLDVLYYDAEINNELGNYAAAKQSMLTAIANAGTDDPKVTAKLYYELGFAYHKLGEYAKSKEAFEKANFGPFRAMVVKFQPDYYTNIANCHAMVYDYEEATKFAKEAIKIDPDFAPANSLLGEIYENSVDQSKAIEYYKKTVKADSKDIKTYVKLIELLMKSRKYAEAIKYADECLASDPKNKKASFIKAVALYETGKTLDAITIMNELLNEPVLTPMDKVSYEFTLGLMYKAVQDYEKAKVSFKNAAKGPFAYAAQYEYDDVQTKLMAKTN